MLGTTFEESPALETETIVARRPRVSPKFSYATPLDPAVSLRVRGLLNAAAAPAPPIERRRDQRHAYPQLVRLTPVAEDGCTVTGQTIVVVGKTLSERGLGFFHQQPLAHRKMVAQFHAGGGRWLGLVIDISWCRFTGHGWYESGGRFLQVAEGEG